MRKYFQIGCLVGLGLFPLPGFSNTATPLPPVEKVIKHALERGKLEAENDRQFKQQYYYVRSRQTEIRNADGDIKKFKSKISTNAPTTATAPETEPPVPRPAQVESPKQAAKSKSEVPAEVSRKFDRDQIQFNQDLVNRFDFKLIGREQTNGSSRLVVDFAPKKKKLPENGIQDRVINRMAGRIWVDEREFAIQKCALNLTESISILGGIVGEAQKFHYAFERERTEEGLWYVKESSWHLEGRQVVVHREADYHEKRTEVRKHN